jgi:hypothetical protein
LFPQWIGWKAIKVAQEILQPLWAMRPDHK